MPVRIIEAKPVQQPVERVTLMSRHGERGVTVRPTSGDGVDGGRTIECYGPRGLFKFVATLGDLRAFGEALIRIADGK